MTLSSPTVDWLLSPGSCPGFLRAEKKEHLEKTPHIHHTEYLFVKIPKRYALVNITEQIEASESLRDSEQRYRMLAESISDVIFSTGSDLQLNYVSPSVIPVLGYDSERQQSLLRQLG